MISEKKLANRKEFWLNNFAYTFTTATWSSGNAFVSGVLSSNLKQVKSNTVLPTAFHRSNISSKEAVLPGHNDAEMDSQTRCTLRHNTASVIKNLIWLHNFLN